MTDPIDDPEPRPARVESSAKWLTFDIETRPAPESELLASMPEFRPAANLKDPVKIAASIEEKKATYIANAALSPMSGRICAVGIQASWLDEPVLIHGEDEKRVVTTAVDVIGGAMLDRIRCVGFNIHGFDLPFLRFRALAHGLDVRHWTTVRGRAYWNEHFRDLLPELVMGRDFAGYNLDAVCRALGLGRKNGNGAQFWETYQKDKAAALDYLKNDLSMETALAKRMGVVE